MKISILLLNSLLLVTFSVHSQNTQPIVINAQASQGIHFEKVASFQQLVKMAKKENKLLFVDCLLPGAGRAGICRTLFLPIAK